MYNNNLKITINIVLKHLEYIGTNRIIKNYMLHFSPINNNLIIFSYGKFNKKYHTKKNSGFKLPGQCTHCSVFNTFPVSYYIILLCSMYLIIWIIILLKYEFNIWNS